MALYKLTQGTGVIKTLPDGFRENFGPGTSEYDRYTAWLAEGNIPDPADPPTLQFQTDLKLFARVQTTNATATELWRATLAQNTGYSLKLTLLGVDTSNGAIRKIVADATVKRLAAGALAVGVLTTLVNHADAAAATWAIAATLQGNDAVVTVTGAAGRTIEWNLAIEVIRFTPGGF